MPINSAYGDGHHLIHHQDPTEPHNHIINPSSSSPQPQTIIPISNNNGSSAAIATATAATGLQDHMVPAGGFNNSKKAQAAAAVIIRYRECLKNHAAAMGANATDGCGEFMPSGEEGSIEALKCSACNCHRNFHRKEVEGGGGDDDDDDHHRHHDYHNYHYVHRHHQQNMFRSGGGGGMGSSSSRKFIFGHPTATRTAGPVLPPHHHPHHMIMSYNNMGPHLPSESDEQDQDHHGGGAGGVGTIMVRPPQLIKKRFRTKFSQEQKEKMLNFAEKVGWKIQKQEESVVQQFCQEIGVKRRVLKVWMHNNKHNLAKKNNSNVQIQNQV